MAQYTRLDTFVESERAKFTLGSSDIDTDSSSCKLDQELEEAVSIPLQLQHPSDIMADSRPRSELTSRKPCVVFRLNGTLFCVGVLSMPLVAFLIAVVVSMTKDFKASTATHCRVWNIFPSISAAISCCTPQRYLWRLLIALHTSPRFMVAVMYYNHYMAFPITQSRGLYNILVTVNSSLHVLENLCLLLLSFVMSHENYDIHEKGFIGFMIFSLLYMMLTLGIFSWSRSSAPWTQRDLKSFRQKKWLFAFNLITFLVSVYFFFRHNWYCEPGVYSIYSFLEYLVVISNVAFHGTAIYEYGQGELVFSEVPIEKLKST